MAAISLLFGALLAFYLGAEVFKTLQREKRERKEKERAFEEAVMAWMDEPSEENKKKAEEAEEEMNGS